jgi:hypothetical protein
MCARRLCDNISSNEADIVIPAATSRSQRNLPDSEGMLAASMALLTDPHASEVHGKRACALCGTEFTPSWEEATKARRASLVGDADHVVHIEGFAKGGNRL